MPGRRVHGFGFDPGESPYHFAAVIPRDDGAVRIEERIAERAEAPPRSATVKAILDRYRWSRIADPVRAHFNRRLREAALRSATWKPGATLLAPYFGKELTLLAWAVEDADSTVIPNMVANWLGLAPEERWWLYTTVNATHGHPEHGRDRGWRKAIKIALAENPSTDPASGVLVVEADRLPPPPSTAPPATPGRARRDGRASTPPEGQLSLLTEDHP